MCIRDSDCVDQEVDLHDRHAEDTRSHQDEHLSHLCQPRTCLLYTSDAADERSSVDLGGRRIIKKQKLRTS